MKHYSTTISNCRWRIFVLKNFRFKYLLISIAAIFISFIYINITNVNANQRNVYDLSEWQGNFTDSQVKQLKNEVPFVILRVQYGSAYYDRTFQHNRNLLDKYKVPYGVYSFSQYESVNDAKGEARALYKRAPNAKFYVNDYEDQTVKSGDTNAATLAWVNELRPLAKNKKILFYSYQSFMLQYAAEAISSYDGYWLAAYQSNEPKREHVLWQYTDHFYSPALGKYIDSSLLTSKKSNWFIGNQKPVVNTKYYRDGGQFTTKSKFNENFYDHVALDNKYAHNFKLKNYGSKYHAKTINIDCRAIVDGKTFYRCYYRGKLLGWISSYALGPHINYGKTSDYKTVKKNPLNNFYNHVTNSHFNNIKMAYHGHKYANKKLKITAKAKKDGWHSYYYQCYYNGKYLGWIYQGAFK